MNTFHLSKGRRCGGRAAASLLVSIMVLSAGLVAVTPTRGDNVDRNAIARAHKFLNTAKRGRDILGYLHCGSAYGGHEDKETRFVTNDAGRIPGHFALVYTFTWDGDGWTDLAFLCDSDGDIYEVKALGNNAIFNQPFVKADLTIKLLGSVLVELFKSEMTDEDRRAVQQFIDKADAKGLLEWSLQFQQAREH